MSLATETSTAEEKTVYSVCGLLQFSKHYAGQLIVSVLFLLLAFGQNFLAIPSRLIHRESSKMKIRCINRGSSWNDLG